MCHSQLDWESRNVWIPAFAGMTKYGESQHMWRLLSADLEEQNI